MKSRLVIAAAVIILIVIAATSGYLAGVASSRTVTSTTTLTSTTSATVQQTTTITATSTSYELVNCGLFSPNSTSQYATDCKLGVTLGLSERFTSVVIASNQTFYISLKNDLPVANNINYSSTPISLPGVNSSNGSIVYYYLPVMPPCVIPESFPPMFFAIYNASGVPLPLNDVGLSSVQCPAMISSLYHQFNASQTMRNSISVGGYWMGTDPKAPWVNATFHTFLPGNYTVLAFDFWNQTAKLSFSVAPPPTTG
jgi:hypothetical protein